MDFWLLLIFVEFKIYSSTSHSVPFRDQDVQIFLSIDWQCLKIGLNNMNIIFSFIILYYSNHLRLQFELSKNSILMEQINNIYETYTEIYQISICCTSTSIITEQKVWKVEAKVFFILPSALTLTLGKSVLCRVPWTWHSAKEYICRVPELRHSANTTSVTALGRRWITWRARAIFAECYKHGTRQKPILPCVCVPALGKRQICRVSKCCRVFSG